MRAGHVSCQIGRAAPPASLSSGVGCLLLMLHKPEKLLRDTGRFWEVLVEWICAFISAIVAAVLIWIAHLVVWRNPREYGVNDLYKGTTLFIFLVLLAIVAGFSVIAFRLLIRKRGHAGLMSPMLLRIWGAFFGITSILVLMDVIMKKRWIEASHYLITLTGSISMAIAAFMLARRREPRSGHRDEYPANGFEYEFIFDLPSGGFKKLTKKKPNQGVEGTGASRSAHVEFVVLWRLAPAAHAGRSAARAYQVPGRDVDVRRGDFLTAYLR